jgi:hypothetical protein
MRKEFRAKPVYEQVQVGLSAVPVFITSDYKEFDSEEKAKQHEDSLIDYDKLMEEKYHLTEIEHNKYSLAVFLNKQDREQVEKDFKHFWKHYFISFDDLGDGWNFIERDESGDYSYLYIIKSSDLLKEYTNNIQNLNSTLNNLNNKIMEESI